MLPLAKALLVTVFLDLTLGLMLLALVWSLLSLLNAATGVIIAGEALASLLIIAASVPLFQRIVRNERAMLLAQEEG